jgi:hypothetical protein
MEKISPTELGTRCTIGPQLPPCIRMFFKENGKQCCYIIPTTGDYYPDIPGKLSEDDETWDHFTDFASKSKPKSPPIWPHHIFREQKCKNNPEEFPSNVV